MSVNGITTNTGLTTGKTSYSDRSKKTGNENTSSVKSENTEAAIYEKSDEKDVSVKQERKVDAETIARLKAEADERMASLRSLVEKMMTKQGQAIAKAGVLDFENGTNLADIFKNLEVDEETRAQAQADIAEDDTCTVIVTLLVGDVINRQGMTLLTKTADGFNEASISLVSV